MTEIAIGIATWRAHRGGERIIPLQAESKVESRKPSWQPCPRCGSARVKITGKLEHFGIGCAVLILGAPLTTIIASVFIGGFGFAIGALLAVFGLLMMIVAPFGVPSGECRDCQKRWTVTQEPA